MHTAAQISTQRPTLVYPFMFTNLFVILLERYNHVYYIDFNFSPDWVNCKDLQEKLMN